MLSVEIYGLPKLSRQTADLMGKITCQLDGAAYRDQVFFNQIDSATFDNRGDSEPYLRIWSTNQADLEDIVGRLMELDVKIQVPPLLSNFIERKSLRDEAYEKLKSLRPKSGTDREFQYPAK